jgi:dihydrofolate reductase
MSLQYEILKRLVKAVNIKKRWLSVSTEELLENRRKQNAKNKIPKLRDDAFDIRQTTVNGFPVLQLIHKKRTDRANLFIIGGGMMYRQMIARADRVYVTRIHTVVEPADAFFPDIDPAQWQEVLRSIRYHDEASGFDYTFLLYERRK